MNTAPRKQPLSEAVASIISMMLGLLRAQGWRGLLQLPTLWLVAREIRRIGDALGALIVAFEAGTLPPIPPAPELAPLEPLPTRAAAAPRVAARPRAPNSTCRAPAQPDAEDCAA